MEQETRGGRRGGARTLHLQLVALGGNYVAQLGSGGLGLVVRLFQELRGQSFGLGWGEIKRPRKRIMKEGENKVEQE